VLYLVDPLDSFMLAGLTEYEGFALKNVDDPTLELPEAGDKPAEQAEAVSEADFDALVARFKAQLGERIADVRASDRLVDNPVRLVSPEGGRGREMDRVRRLLEKDFSVPKLVVEINRGHALIKNLAALIEAGEAAGTVEAVIEQLYENGLLTEGLHANPASMVTRIQALMLAATQPK
jgi:molecular chaperone HtpG